MNVEKISQSVQHELDRGCQGGCARALIIFGLLAASAGAGYLVTRDEFQDNVIDAIIPDNARTPTPEIRNFNAR